MKRDTWAAPTVVLFHGFSAGSTSTLASLIVGSSIGGPDTADHDDVGVPATAASVLRAARPGPTGFVKAWSPVGDGAGAACHNRNVGRSDTGPRDGDPASGLQRWVVDWFGMPSIGHSSVPTVGRVKDSTISRVASGSEIHFE